MEVREERLREDILSNAEFGSIDADDGRGRTVLTGSEADQRVRSHFVDCLQSVGLEVRVDPVGNIAGRWIPKSANPDRAPVAVGSHLDSVPEGGIFDGPLGVYAALESVRAIRASELEPRRPIDVVSFTEEEGGRFGVGLLGSSVAGGQRSSDEVLTLEDDAGRTCRELLADIGFQGEGTVSADEWDAWLELHIEQGRRLEQSDAAAGVVTAISGITNCEVEITGEANHAGSTPMGERVDALTAASEFVIELEETAQELAASTNPAAVATVGKQTVHPGGRNVIPGRVELTMDVRDIESGSMDELVDRACDHLTALETERGVETNLDRYRTTEPTEMSDRCRDALERAGTQLGVETRTLHSGAGHDTANLADSTDVGLLFAPSRDGISHNPREWTAWEGCAATTEVLAGALADLAGCDLRAA